MKRSSERRKRRGERLRMRLERTAEMWPVGNYLEFFLAAAFTQLLFWILMAYRYLSDFGEVVDYTTWQWSTFAVILNCTMGWMILVGMGIASNLWPIVYQNTPFNPSIIRAGISMNIAGQVVVFIAHLLLQRQVSVADQVLTIGVSLLCLSAFIGASPAWSYFFEDEAGNRFNDITVDARDTKRLYFIATVENSDEYSAFTVRITNKDDSNSIDDDGDGIPDSEDACPNKRPNAWILEEPDHDGDGIIDSEEILAGTNPCR